MYLNMSKMNNFTGTSGPHRLNQFVLTNVRMPKEWCTVCSNKFIGVLLGHLTFDKETHIG